MHLSPIIRRIEFCLVLFLALSIPASAQDAGDNLFNDQVHDIHLYFSQPAYWDSLVNNKAVDDTFNTSTFIPAMAVVDGIIADSTGIQLRGRSSYDDYPGNKKPFQLSFDEYIDGQKYDGLKSLNLDNFYLDPTFTRQKLFLNWMNENGMYAPRASYARLYLNDAYWGLYLMVERVNKTFCDIHFNNNDGNLFKGDHLEGKCANLKYHNQVEDYYECYELKTNEDVNDWTDLVTLTDRINNTSDTEFRDTLEKYLNTTAFINQWVAYNLFADVDAYPFAYQHNYYLYHNLATDRFEWIAWDVNVILGVEKSGNNNLQEMDVLDLTPPEGDKPLCQRMLENAEYKYQYLQTYCQLASYAFDPALFDSITAPWRFLIQQDVYEDTLKMFTNSDFDLSMFDDVMYLNKTIPALFPFILERSSSVMNQLAALGYGECTFPTGLIADGGISNPIVFPNPFNDYTTIQFSDHGLSDPVELEVYDVSGHLFFRKTVYPGNKIKIGSELPPGFYFIELNENSQRKILPALKN